MMSEGQIRLATGTDSDCLAKIYLQSRIASGSFSSGKALKTEDFFNDTLEEEVYVYEMNQRIVGFISIYQPDLFIHLLFVHPDYFGQGIGKELLTFAKSKYGLPLTLKCLVKNRKAQHFYEHLGFVREEKVKTGLVNHDYYIYCLRK